MKVKPGGVVCQSTSVNSNTPPELCKVKYPDFNEAIRRCLEEGVNCNLSRSAFRNLGISKRFWRYLIMRAKCPIDGIWYYFVDKCLPFGASISCALFQEVSNAIVHLVEFKTNKEVINYLEDYLFIALLKRLCNLQMQIFLDICKAINFPVSEEKTFPADTVMTFLGFLIDANKQMIAVPCEKISKARNMLSYILAKESKPPSKRKITVLQIQKICGF